MPFVPPGVVNIPARNSFEEGAMLEPANTVLEAVRRLSLQPGDAVLVADQGPIGLMFARLLQLAGACVLATDLLEARLKPDHRFGSRWVCRGDDGRLGETISRLTWRRGLDAAVIAVPLDQVVLQALTWLRGGGKLMLFALTRQAWRLIWIWPPSACMIKTCSAAIPPISSCKRKWPGRFFGGTLMCAN